MWLCSVQLLYVCGEFEWDIYVCKKYQCVVLVCLSISPEPKTLNNSIPLPHLDSKKELSSPILEDYVHMQAQSDSPTDV